MAMFPIMCILSISRISIIRSNSTSAALTLSFPLKVSLFALQEVFKILVVFGWLLSIAFWLTTLIGQNFTFEGIGWTYDDKKPLSDILSKLEYYICFPTLLTSYLMYLIIISQMMMVSGSHWSNWLLQIRTRSGTNRSKELSIFLQSTFMTFYICTLILLWHNAGENKWNWSNLF